MWFYSTRTQPRGVGNFYNTPAWREARAAALRRDGYRCVICDRDISGKGQARVDHIKPLRTYPELALSLANLRSLCTTHDNQAHREKGRGGGSRIERFGGCDANGQPLDPMHHWRGRRRP